MEQQTTGARRKDWIVLGVVAIAGFAADLLTKLWAIGALTGGRHIEVIGDMLSFVLVYNRGGLFGTDPRALIPWLPVNAFFITFNFIAMVFIVAYYARVAGRDTFLRWGLALVLPGALGNVFDRIVRPGKGVVDFIMMDFNVWPANPWPIYNVADIFVTCGVALILASLVRDELRRAGASRAQKTAPDAATEQTPPA